MTRPVPDAHARPLRRVVIADGDADTRSMYREALWGLPLDIVDVGDGCDALVQCLVEPPALLVTDTYLSTLDGYQLCQLLRRDRATRSVPILIVTAESRPAELTRLRQVGTAEVLSKPLLPERFCAEVLRLSEGVAPEVAAAPTNGSGKAASRRFHRFETIAPPHEPPALHCRECDRPLDYQKSRVGGVSESNPEQWDQFRCPACAGTFEYRHRTRHLRRVVSP